MKVYLSFIPRLEEITHQRHLLALLEEKPIKEFIFHLEKLDNLLPIGTIIIMPVKLIVSNEETLDRYMEFQIESPCSYSIETDTGKMQVMLSKTDLTAEEFAKVINRTWQDGPNDDTF